MGAVGPDSKKSSFALICALFTVHPLYTTTRERYTFLHVFAQKCALKNTFLLNDVYKRRRVQFFIATIVDTTHAVSTSTISLLKNDY